MTAVFWFWLTVLWLAVGMLVARGLFAGSPPEKEPEFFCPHGDDWDDCPVCRH